MKNERTADLGCSSKSISVARILDRLEPGDYVISLTKPGNGKQHYWSISIDRKENIDHKVIGEK